jgi:hypothetical protein
MLGPARVMSAGRYGGIYVLIQARASSSGPADTDLGPRTAGRKTVVTEVLDGSGAERDNRSGVDVPPDGQRRRRTPCRRMTMRSIR